MEFTKTPEESHVTESKREKGFLARTCEAVGKLVCARSRSTAEFFWCPKNWVRKRPLNYRVLRSP